MSIPMFGITGHTVSVDRRLPVGAREKRTWSCSCGWRTVGYDSTAKTAARRHVREQTRKAS